MSNDKCKIHITENYRHEPSTTLVTKHEQALYFVGIPQNQRIVHVQHKYVDNFRLIIKKLFSSIAGS